MVLLLSDRFIRVRFASLGRSRRWNDDDGTTLIKGRRSCRRRHYYEHRSCPPPRVIRILMAASTAQKYLTAALVAVTTLSSSYAFARVRCEFVKNNKKTLERAYKWGLIWTPAHKSVAMLAQRRHCNERCLLATALVQVTCCVSPFFFRSPTPFSYDMYTIRGWFFFYTGLGCFYLYLTNKVFTNGVNSSTVTFAPTGKIICSCFIYFFVKPSIRWLSDRLQMWEGKKKKKNYRVHQHKSTFDVNKCVQCFIPFL